MAKPQKVVIVGAGMAGLTAAAYLTRENFEVLLLEKNDRTGGLVSTFNYEGFSFDSGPRAFVNSGIVKPILKQLGIQLEYLENKIAIGVEDKIFNVTSMAALKDYQDLLISLYKEDAGEIQKIISIIAKLSKYTEVLYEFDNPNFVDFRSQKGYLRKLIPWTFKFLHALFKMNQFASPMEEFLKKITANQSLIDILTQMFFRKTPTHFALGYFYVYLDYFYPLGGTGAISKALEEKALQNGAKIKFKTSIVEVRASQRCVVDASGNTYEYEHLIWAADLKSLYSSINTEGLDNEIVKEIEQHSKRIQSAKGAESALIMFLGVDSPKSFFAERGGEHMFFTPSRSGLGETNLQERVELLNNFGKLSKTEVFKWLEKYLRLNTFEVSVPALRDPELAPEGKTGISISCLFDFQLIQKMDAAGWYQEFKEFVEKTVINIFSQSIYPGLDGKVLFKFLSTPLTINRLVGSSEGALTGWSFETEIPVINKLAEIPNSVLTPIPGVFKAGQWAYAPAGVPIAMLTGWYAFQKILKRS